MSPNRVQTSVTLFGSPPWGFRVSGGKEFNQPLVISRVTPGSVAAKSGVVSGDVVIAINGQFASEMTQEHCEEKVKQAVGSLYLVLEKNAATVSVLPSGEVTVEGDRNVYNDEASELERLSRHNRSAKPFPGSYTSTPTDSPTKEAASSNPAKPPGFRSVSFRPNTQLTTPSSAPLPRRSLPDGSPSEGKATYNSQPKQFVPRSDDPLPPPPASGGTGAVVSPNQAASLYSSSNLQSTYQAQVEGK